jgi:hypothetical protein
VTACHQPSPTSSTETTSARPRTLESTGTGAGKRILLSLYELSDEPQQVRQPQSIDLAPQKGVYQRESAGATPERMAL